MKNSDRNYYFGETGKRLFIREWGSVDKRVILLIHGFPGCADHGKLMS
jgi:pimeloyl-ACP methyl ester carboxylesterase